MIKLRQGEKMRQFAMAMEAPIDEVEVWANGMINDPPSHYSKDYPTPEERRDAIQGYMLWVISYDNATGINERIRASIAKEKNAVG